MPQSLQEVCHFRQTKATKPCSPLADQAQDPQQQLMVTQRLSDSTVSGPLAGLCAAATVRSQQLLIAQDLNKAVSVLPALIYRCAHV